LIKKLTTSYVLKFKTNNFQLVNAHLCRNGQAIFKRCLILWGEKIDEESGIKKHHAVYKMKISQVSTLSFKKNVIKTAVTK